MLKAVQEGWKDVVDAYILLVNVNQGDVEDISRTGWGRADRLEESGDLDFPSEGDSIVQNGFGDFAQSAVDLREGDQGVSVKTVEYLEPELNW